MATRLTDDELRERVVRAIEIGQPRTELGFRLIAEGFSCGRERLERMWAEEGGPVRQHYRLYVSGTGPLDRGGWR